MSTLPPIILENLAIPTGVMRSGSTVRDFFTEALRCRVPGLPYVDAKGRITGRLSIRHCFKQSAIPHYLIDSAHLLGDDIHEVNITHSDLPKFLATPVEQFLLKPMALTSSRSPLIKALAIMEHFNTSYIFLIDGIEYRGIVTHMEIAHRLLEHSGLVA
jgi:hypothetical protein